MAIPISDYQNPRFRRIPTGATMSRDDNARFAAMPYGGSNTRAFRSAPQPGYNAAYPRVTPLKINLNNANLSLPPDAR